MVSRPGRAVVALAAPLVVAVVAFIAIRATLLTGVDFWDTGELQTVGPLLGTAHPTGFPTYVILGWLGSVVLAPFGEPALRMNLLSAIYVVVAAAVTVDLVRALTRSTALGMAAGLGLALTPLVWALGTRAEAHALHLLFVAVIVRLLVAWEARRSAERDRQPLGPERGTGADRLLVVAAGVFGLSMGNHSLTLLLVAPIVVYVVAVDPAVLRRPRFIALCAGVALGAAALVFLQLPLRAGPFRAPLVYGEPDTWDGFWYIVLAQQFQGSIVGPFTDLAGKVHDLVDRAVAAFGILAPLIPLGFVATALTRPRYALLGGAATLLTTFFAASYVNADIGRYYAAPVFFAWTWLAILAAVLVRAGVAVATPAVTAILGPRPGRAMVGAVIAVGLAAVLLVPTALDLGTRARSVDRSRDLAARAWLDRAFRLMRPDAVVVSWWSYSTPLWYGQHVEGRRPDIAIIDDRTRLDEGLGDIYDVIDANLQSRPVYVIRADPREIAGLAARYVLEPLEGVDARSLTRVVARRETGS